ncbi:HEPN domain-containing protein [uncultured Rummeliibacillus sp.]|uniref:HEPN domain-containing protein n=1 Tax=uncultured Rummeliibacillus sp. TaxID=762292 RepID=UPI0026059189|nr:HEPN domain-containing protein [uncultured Rummeliibacillus sp.]
MNKIISLIKNKESFHLAVNLLKIQSDGSEEYIPGTLIFEEKELHLVTRGRFPNRKNDFDNEEEEIRIIGVSSSEKFVAINPLLVGSGFSSSGISTSKFFIPEMLINTDYKSNIVYNSCSIELSNFPMWLGIKKLLHTYSEEPEFFLKVNQIDKLKYQFNIDGEFVNLEFIPTFTPNENGFEQLEIRYRTLINIEPSSPKNKYWFNEIVQKITDLFTLLIGVPIEVSYHNFHIDDKPTIQYYRRGYTDTNYEMLSDRRQMLFPYNTIHQHLPQLIENWFNIVRDKAKYKIIRLLISNFYLRQYEESIFLNYMQGIEGYHRLFYGGGYIDEKKYAKDKKKINNFINKEMEDWSIELKKAVKDRIIYGYEYSLNYRLEELMEKLDKRIIDILFDDGEVALFIKEVKNLRNQLTHPNPKKSNQVEIGHISTLNTQLKILFMIFIYIELEISSDDIVTAFTSSTKYRYQLRNK